MLVKTFSFASFIPVENLRITVLYTITPYVTARGSTWELTAIVHLAVVYWLASRKRDSSPRFVFHSETTVSPSLLRKICSDTSMLSFSAHTICATIRQRFLPLPINDTEKNSRVKQLCKRIIETGETVSFLFHQNGLTFSEILNVGGAATIFIKEMH